MVLPLVSVTVVTSVCGTPWVTVPEVAPLRLMLIVAGGQVEKYPAVEAEPATEAVM